MVCQKVFLFNTISLRGYFLRDHASEMELDLS